LAALMALCVAQAVPASRPQRIGESCAIVWIARARTEQRGTIERRCPRPRVRIAISLPHETRSGGRFFSKSLYQRPPPSSLG